MIVLYLQKINLEVRVFRFPDFIIPFKGKAFFHWYGSG